ncbi:unnamed protein product [Arctia plantaginis]|uniref:Uncharacterized protein n=1 Tax=Arctia plantaginis TaxID=874455 RepID=A0A8S1ADV2_ARCPL|nr:unnamed protein product [Arctia plantaginis]
MLSDVEVLFSSCAAVQWKRTLASSRASAGVGIGGQERHEPWPAPETTAHSTRSGPSSLVPPFILSHSIHN